MKLLLTSGEGLIISFLEHLSKYVLMSIYNLTDLWYFTHLHGFLRISIYIEKCRKTVEIFRNRKIPKYMYVLFSFGSHLHTLKRYANHTVCNPLYLDWNMFFLYIQSTCYRKWKYHSSSLLKVQRSRSSSDAFTMTLKTFKNFHQYCKDFSELCDFFIIFQDFLWFAYISWYFKNIQCDISTFH